MPRTHPSLAVAALVAVLVAGTAAGCARPPDSDALVIGAVYPVSGKQGPGGTEEAAGARLAVELANARGGVHGRPVRLDIVDVGAGEAAPSAMDDLKRRGVDLVLGSYGSTISAPAAVAAQRRGMLLWETGAVGEIAPEAGAGESFFRLAPMGASLGRAAVAFVRDQLQPLLGPPAELRYAVAYVDDAYGRSVGLGAVDEVERSGHVLAGAFPYDLRGFDAPALVRAIAETRPDVLFVSAYLEDGVALRAETVAQGLPLRASVGTSSSYCMPSFAARLGAAAVGLFASDKPDAAQVRADALSPEAKDALDWANRRYRQRHGEDMTPAALSGFANTWALVGHVLPAAGPGAAVGTVAEAARGVKLGPGSLPNGAGLDLTGPGVLDAGENRAAVSVIWQWVDDRTQAVVWPPAFATRPLQAIPIL
ncbi:MAG TPA: ABC transporter substrate-binding protein [Acidimicrobiales bacterium]|jgi:branched-chain amino acid transport system substrate-binding protein|nr:ABC transporter substrate-binding protein [Acidimicrobiales bacterium]